MRELVHIKTLNVPEFKDALLETVGYTLAEATSHPLWASGLGPDMTEITKPEYWPGKNMMGVLLMEDQAALSRDAERQQHDDKEGSSDDDDDDDDVLGVAPPSSVTPAASASPVMSAASASHSPQPRPHGEKRDNDVSVKDNNKQCTGASGNKENKKKGPMDKYTTETQPKRKPSSSPDGTTKKDSKMPRPSKDAAADSKGS